MFEGYVSKYTFNKIREYIYHGDETSFNLINVLERLNEMKDIDIGPIDDNYIYKDLIRESINGQKNKNFYGYIRSTEDLSEILSLNNDCLTNIMKFQTVETKIPEKFDPEMENRLPNNEYINYLKELCKKMRKYATVVNHDVTKKIFERSFKGL